MIDIVVSKNSSKQYCNRNIGVHPVHLQIQWPEPVLRPFEMGIDPIKRYRSLCTCPNP